LQTVCWTTKAGCFASLAELMPNAAPQPRLEAGAKRRLEGVGCRRLIMIEASPSAYPSGMLVVGKSR
jgi:hypothetical protein